MHYSKEPAINCFIISSSYNAARAIFYGVTRLTVTVPYGAIINPAIAVGITLGSLIAHGASAFTYFWIYPVMPFVGALAAWAFYEFIYKKTQMMLDHTHAEHDEAVKEEQYESGLVNEGVLDN
jgi:hypothetical protein